MTLYNATASATITDTETTITQISFNDNVGRARLLGWDISFDGIIAGNNMLVSLYRTDSVGGSDYVNAVVLDGEGKFATAPPNYATIGGAPPSMDGQLDLVHVADSAYFKKQYAYGREPVFGGGVSNGRLCATVTPGALVAPVHCKMNLIFSL